MPHEARNKVASGSDSADTGEEFPFDRGTASVEEKKLANAVARGKMVLWPATFVATLGIGIGCSGGGIVKTKGWKDRFYFWIFVATLAGWAVLLVIQGTIMNELYTQRKKSRNAKVVVALALAFGGWVSGYFLAILAIYLIWRPIEPEGSGANALLMVQAILGVGGSLVGLWFYFQGYVKPVRAVPAHLEEKSNIKTPVRRLSRAVGRRFSKNSGRSGRLNRSKTSDGSQKRRQSKQASASKSSTSRPLRTRTVASGLSETDSASSASDISKVPIRSSPSNSKSASRPGRTASSKRGNSTRSPLRSSAGSGSDSSSGGTDTSARTDTDDDQHQLLASGDNTASSSAHQAPSPSAPARPSPTPSYPPLPPPPPQYSPYPPSGARPPPHLTVPVRIENGAQTVYTGNWDLDAQKYVP